MSTGHMQRLNRRFWQTWRWYRFRLFQRHRFNRLVLEWVAARPFLILPEVFNPTLFFTSELMVGSFNAQLIPPGSRVLDMGTGSGVGAVFAAQWARQKSARQGTAGQVVAVDINPTAVRCARINVMLNELENCVAVRQGDLFTAVPGEKFDVILFNPPYFQGEPQDMLDRAFHATGVLERFAAEAAGHLNPGGSVLLVSSSLTAVDAILHLFQAQGFTPQTVAQQKLRGETLWLHRLENLRNL